MAKAKLHIAAVDIGASGGRVLGVHFDGQRLATEAVHRFPNVPVQARDRLHWDVLHLWQEMQFGLSKIDSMSAIGLATWGVDFGLLDKAGRLIGNPVHYRDPRTEGMMAAVFTKVPRQQVFAQTGIQMMPINTLYQLYSLVVSDDSALRHAARLVTIPDLLYYWLTGTLINEYTNATTTQCFDVQSGDWAYSLLEALGIPTHLFQPVSQAGQILGSYGQIPVVLTPHHDTACAVLGVPSTTDDVAYLSSGTWSLIGQELAAPVVNDAVLHANLTNEGGYNGTIRFLKNVMGLWLLQESQRAWADQGSTYTIEALMQQARESSAFHALIDPDDPCFLPAGDMPARIQTYCQQTSQPVPQSVGEITRCIFESLALKYAHVLTQISTLSGKPISVIHVVGGGSQNSLLCQMTADATAYTVVAEPVEATALGNALVQLIALGEIRSVREGRALLRESFALKTYQPQHTATWQAAKVRFQALLQTTAP